MSKFRVFILCAVFAFATMAHAQISRTWVSGLGDDTDPCSREAPCRTFAGAMSNTNNNGEISAIDAGGFGALSITKSVYINGGEHLASILGSSGATGILINAPGGDVVLRNLDINGLQAGSTAIKIIAADSVMIDGCRISQWGGHGIEIANATGLIKVSVRNSYIYDNNGHGVSINTTGTGQARLVVSDSYLTQHLAAGVFVGGEHNVAMLSNTELDHNSIGIQVNQSTSGVRMEGVGIYFSSIAINAGLAGQNPTIRLSRCHLANNISTYSGGGTPTGCGNNVLVDNGGPGLLGGGCAEQ